MATGLINFKAPDDIREEELDEDIGNSRLSEIAKSFDPPVSTAKCKTREERKERLRCAYRKAKGKSLNIDSFGSLMKDLNNTDHEKRMHLKGLFDSANQLLDRLFKEDAGIKDYLQHEEGTRDAKRKIQRFTHLLMSKECPVVVAGQVSSGKSTLLNLFLGSEYLPSQTLSCTATICELTYNTTEKAQVIEKNGKVHEIDFEEKNKYIFKESERDSLFDHEAVKLYLPVEFLKSGIMLVDTPGVGESTAMSEVLVDYVTKTDVFGFIFVINAFDSGGVLIRFKEMLRKLSSIRNEEGQLKFCPKSVIFIANLWDKVPDEDKPATWELITNTLKGEPCMKKFVPDKQLFHMNSLFAWNTWNVGLISEDYEKVIHGVQNFFPIGHKRKLDLAYKWLENLLLRILHRVMTFLNKATQRMSFYEKNQEDIGTKLQTIRNQANSSNYDLNLQFNREREKLRKSVQDFLKSREMTSNVTTWNLNEIPKEEYGDSWILLEERIDTAIDRKISLQLQEWEAKEQKFFKTEESLIKSLRMKYDPLFQSLNQVEKELRSMSIARAGYSEDEQESDTVKVERDSRLREFELAVTHEVTNPENVKWNEVLNNIMFNPSTLFQMDKKKKRHQVMQKNAEQFKKDRIGFVVERSKTVLQEIQNSNDFVYNQVDKQMAIIKENFGRIHETLNQFIRTNRNLMDEVLKDRRETPHLKGTFLPLSDSVNNLLDNTLAFKYRNLEENIYSGDQLQDIQRFGKRLSQAKSNLPIPLHGKFQNKILEKREVAVKEISSILRKRHLFFMVDNTQNLAKTKREFIPIVVGYLMDCEEIPKVIYEGKLTKARTELLTKSPMGRALYLKNRVFPFLSEVGKALEFLHLKKLVHLEVSLDSIMMNEGRPKLSNIFESMDVPFPFEPDVKAENYIYLPPETFPSSLGSMKYTSAADIYGLALTTLELFANKSLFDEFKQWNLGTFIRDIEDHGMNLYGVIERQTDLASEIPPFIKSCLSMEFMKRPTAKMWNDKFVLYQNEKLGIKR